MASALCALLVGCGSDTSPAPTGTAHRSGSARPTPSGPRTLTVVGAGDVLIHPPVWKQARADARAAGRSGLDFAPIFAGVKPVVSGADLAICHLETPVASAGGPYRGWPRFAAPPQVLTALRSTGYDDCSTASNHTYDQGTVGIGRTVGALDAAGLHHSGSNRSAAAAHRPDIIDVHGVKVAELSYTFGLNSGLSLPAGKPWLVNTTDVPRILKAAHAARAAGAAIVILSMHWGTEYRHAPTQLQRDQATKLLASPDVDLILGCHAHVVQPIDKIHGKWVVYGMGNQIARHEDPIAASREGIMPRITFTASGSGHWRVTKVAAIPTWVDISPRIRLVNLPAALGASDLSAGQRKTYRREYHAIAGAVRADGSPVTVVRPG